MGRHKLHYEIYHCMDCGKQLTYEAIRCRSCHSKRNATQQWSTTRDKMMIATHTQHCTKTRLEKLNNPEYKKAMSDKLNKQWADTGFRKVVTDAAVLQAERRTTDADYKKARSEQFTKMWADPNSNLRKYAMIFGPSSLELIFKQYLDAENISYAQQYQPLGYHRYYDFYLPYYNALIEIDGMFWHYSELAVQRGYDKVYKEKDEFAYNNGYIMVRIPECDLEPTVVENWLLPILEQYASIHY
jgi:hypothetical protein